jgi:hypothetical protein
LIEIGWATSADIPGVIDVLKEIADFRASLGQDRWDKASFTPAAVQDWIDRRELVVARLGGRVIGTMLVQDLDPVFWPERGPHEALYVHKLARTRTAPEARGLVKPLVDFAEEETRRRGLPVVRLDCALDEKLCAIYAGLGFRRLDIVEPRAGLVSWRWEKAV